MKNQKKARKNGRIFLALLSVIAMMAGIFCPVTGFAAAPELDPYLGTFYSLTNGDYIIILSTDNAGKLCVSEGNADGEENLYSCTYSSYTLEGSTVRAVNQEGSVDEYVFYEGGYLDALLIGAGSAFYESYMQEEAYFDVNTSDSCERVSVGEVVNNVWTNLNGYRIELGEASGDGSLYLNIYETFNDMPAWSGYYVESEYGDAWGKSGLFLAFANDTSDNTYYLKFPSRENMSQPVLIGSNYIGMAHYPGMTGKFSFSYAIDLSQVN